MAQTPPPVYGIQKPGLPKRLGERLRELWEPHEYVRIMNIDDETFYWQSLSPQDENYEIDRGPTKIIYRRDPRQYSIKPGESVPLEGWNAYVAVEQLYKKIMAKNANLRGEQRKHADGKPTETIINWEDPAGWDKYLPQIFLGREVPTFGDQTVPKPVSDVETPQTGSVTATEAIANATGNTSSVNELAKELGLEIAN